MSARVKHFLSARLHALKEERHFALIGGVAFLTVGSLVIHADQDTRSDASISSVTTLIMNTTSNSSVREADIMCVSKSAAFLRCHYMCAQSAAQAIILKCDCNPEHTH
jgi:hypothetical protein